MTQPKVIAVGGFQHETNTFAPHLADYAAFERADSWPPLTGGAALFDVMRGLNIPLAGFIEPGENIEEAVRREIMEEAGVSVGDVHYHSTQPWPWPSSLMIGCFADATSTEITIDGLELEEARWVSRSLLKDVLNGASDVGVLLPPPMAIGFQLIRAFTEMD